MELRQGTQDWDEVAKQFVHIFEFADEKPTVDVVLQMIKKNIFVEILVEEANFDQCSTSIQQWMAY